MRWFYVIVLFLFFPDHGFSQEYSFSHYDTKDGLVGSTVYCITQDKEGFLWFATETGVSRFDGTHFKNFTREDGLPDNDVFQMFADSKGRVWFSPFRKTVSYYYKGKIYNSENDSLLKKLNIVDNIYQYAEDSEGNILMQDAYRLHLISVKGEVATILTRGKFPICCVSMIAGRKEGGFWVLDRDSLFVFNNNRFTFWRPMQSALLHAHSVKLANETLIWRPDFHKMAILSIPTNSIKQFRFVYDARLTNTVLVDNNHVAYATADGAYVSSIENPETLQHYLPGKFVSNAFKDSEGNWWFSTLGAGAYRLNSAIVMNQSYTATTQFNRIPLYINNDEWQILSNTLQIIKSHVQKNEQAQSLPGFSWFNTNSGIHIISLPGKSIISCSGWYVLKFTPALTLTAWVSIFPVKGLCMHKNTLLMATSKNVVAVDTGTLKILDTIWHERTTCIFSNNDTIYIGTTHGLYQLLPGKMAQYLGEKELFLQGRITDVCEDANHFVWIATAGDGLIAWQHGKAIKRITTHDGLTSNNCRKLFLENGHLWVATDKGLNKINILQPGLPIQKYTTSDGLSSNIIDAVYIHNRKVFIGTSEGITFFDEEKITSHSRCDLRFTDITIGGKTFYPADAPVNIPHNKNNLRFNYVGISYKSGGDVRYRYRLLGLDSTWHETRETFLSYPTLPSGEYQLQVQAINKFDVYSKIITAGFTIEKLLYEKNWFRVLIGLLFLSATGLVVWLIVRRIQKREQQKTDFIKRISELEQLSRKAQMNPHFIFNSLNSIQHYVMEADVAGANKFISGFSRLIRQTLDFSSKPEISLEEELDYLTNYLELEKTRLEDAFSWSVIIDKDVHPGDYHIPPMILQPFVENSVRHGLRFRKDKEGKVTIQIKKENGYLVCILEDNGIGRKAALKYKSVSPIEYQSKGLSLTADRISMFNKESLQPITMHIDDLEDDFHNPLGTRVTISFPVF